MQLWSDSFRPYHFVDPRFALGKHDPVEHFTFSANRNPHLAWSDPPEGTQSFAILCWDSEVPLDSDGVTTEGRTVPLLRPRAAFFHWVLADLPAELREIPEGSHADGFTARGKAIGTTPHGGVAGLNDYTNWFSGHPELEGEYAGYDGMGPPWNDERVHAYHFAVYALGVKSLGLQEKFTGMRLMRALQSHKLAEAVVVGLYSLNPSVREAAALATTRY